MRLVAIALALTFSLLLVPAASAGGPYPTGSTGYDVSWPQCGATLPAQPFGFAIVGATGGRAFYTNPCLRQQFDWAEAGTDAPAALYMNLNYPAGTTAGNGMDGPLGRCSKRDKDCQAYNYGANAAKFAVDYAAQQGASAQTWWLDIETSNTWSKKTALNARVVEGATDYLEGQGLTVGVYSTAFQWQKIVGSYAPGLPNWVAGAANLSGARAMCGPAYAFGGGSVWLTQYVAGGFDNNYAC